MTIRTPALFNPAALGPDLEIEQGGEVLAVTDASLSLSRTALGTIGQAGGAWNFEMMTWAPSGSLSAVVGLATDSALLTGQLGNDALGLGYVLSTGQIRNNNATVTTVAAAELGDIIGVAIDFTAGTVTFSRNGTVLATVSIPGAMVGEILYPAASLGSGSEGDNRLFFNSGQRAFEYPFPTSDGWYTIPVTPDTIRFAEGGSFFSKAGDEIPNQYWDGRISQASVTIVRALNFWPWGSASSRGTAAQVVINDPDGRYDDLIGANIRDLPAQLHDVESMADDFDTAQLVGSFVVESVTVLNDAQKRITLRDSTAALDRPLQSRLFLPNAEGDVANRPVPLCLGACRSVEPIFLREDPGALVYQVSDSACSFGQLRDKGDILLLGSDWDATVGAQGINVYSPPAGKLTIDVSSVGGGSGTTPPSPNLIPTLLADFDTVYGTVSQPGGDGTALIFGPASAINGEIGGYVQVDAVLTAGLSYRISFSLLMDPAVSEAGGTRRVLLGQGVTLIGGGPLVAALTNVVFSADATGVYNATFTAPTTGNLVFGFKSITDRPNNSAQVNNLAVFEVQQIEDLEVEPINLESYARAVLTRGGIEEDQWSAADAQAIDAATSYGLGLYASEPISVGEALQAALVGFTACYWQDSAGLIRFARLIAPGSQAATGTITGEQMLTDLVVIPDQAPGLASQMAGQRNWSVLDPTDFVTDYDPVTGVPINVRKILSRTFRQVRTTGTPFPAEYAHARGAADPVETLIDEPESLQAEIDRIASLYQVKRYFYEVKIDLTAIAGYELGQTWTLQYPRYGLDAGKACLLVSISEDRANRIATLRLWG